MKQFFINVVTWLESTMEPVKNWLVANHRNPLLWVGLAVIVFGFIAIFRSNSNRK